MQARFTACLQPRIQFREKAGKIAEASNSYKEMVSEPCSKNLRVKKERMHGFYLLKIESLIFDVLVL